MMNAGVPMEEVAHNVMTFSEPMKQLEAMIVAGKIHHNGDPVLAWAMGNVMARKDVKDNVYPRKAHEDNKIDPAVALIANISLQLRVQDESIEYTGLRSVS
jgi:phage terminase large subunit-like protein